MPIRTLLLHPPMLWEKQPHFKMLFMYVLSCSIYSIWASIIQSYPCIQLENIIFHISLNMIHKWVFTKPAGNVCIVLHMNINPLDRISRDTCKSFCCDCADGIANVRFQVYASWIVLVQCSLMKSQGTLHPGIWVATALSKWSCVQELPSACPSYPEYMNMTPSTILRNPTASFIKFH